MVESVGDNEEGDGDAEEEAEGREALEDDYYFDGENQFPSRHTGGGTSVQLGRGRIGGMGAHLMRLQQQFPSQGEKHKLVCLG